MQKHVQPCTLQCYLYKLRCNWIECCHIQLLVTQWFIPPTVVVVIAAAVAAAADDDDGNVCVVDANVSC